MLHSDIKREKESFYYVLAISFIGFIGFLLLYFTSDKTMPITFLAVMTILFFIFTLINAEAVMGLYNALALKITSIIVTFAGEFIGVNYGWIFGSYEYTGALGIKFLGVPLLVILCWDVFIYVSYMLIVHTIPDFQKKLRKNKLSFAAIIAILTGLATTSIDLFLDPLAVNYSWWLWDNGGSYFSSLGGGVPLTNFLGWIFLSGLSVFIFTYFFQKPYIEKDTIFDYAPLIPYFANFIAIPIAGLTLGLEGPMFLALFSMAIFILFFLSKRRL